MLDENMIEEPEGNYIHVLKPTSAVVFGIINIIFAIWSIGGTAVGYLLRFFITMNEMQKSMQMPFAYEIFSIIITISLALYLLINGIMLLKASLSARRGFIIYCITLLIITPLLQIYPIIHVLKVVKTMPNAQMMMPIMIVSLFVGFLFSLAYPLIGLIFMTRPSVKEHYLEYNHPRNMANPLNS